jgi:amidohydrolase
MDDDLRREVSRGAAAVVALRRELHGTAETAFKEEATAGIIAARLKAAGLKVETGVGRTGVVGTLEGAGRGPTLMIRADTDGLPVRELTGLPFACVNGSMHACGHDGHMAIAVGAAEALSRLRQRLRGKVVFAFQPAEEVVQGAMAMINDGLLDRVKPDRVIGLHLWNQVPVGRIGVNRGTVFASADAFRLTVTGRGGHGALPHLSVDPVVAAAQVISAAQTVVSREVPPNEMGVLTFGQVHGGSAPNVIADAVTVEGTIRAYRPEVRTLIFDAVQRVAGGVASGMRADATFERMYGSPPVVNNPEVAAWVARHAAAVVGEDGVTELPPVSVGDDMAEFLDRVPGCYFLLGAAKDGAAPHHNARFDFDERCLATGTEVFVRAAVDMMA